MPKRPKIEISSGNVYADLGFADPELEKAKADLAREIRSAIDIRGLTQIEAGKLLSVDQADISRITRGRLGGYSLERLITLLSRLNLRVEFRVVPDVQFGLQRPAHGEDLPKSNGGNQPQSESVSSHDLVATPL